jgi:hypothetical protein
VLGPRNRLILFAVLFPAWLVLLMIGWTLGGAIHLLLAAALVLFPWKQART